MPRLALVGDGWVGEFLGAAARYARDLRAGHGVVLGPAERGWAAAYLQALMVARGVHQRTTS